MHIILSRRRFEQLLISFNIEYSGRSVEAEDPTKKLKPLFKISINNFQNAFHLEISLSLDESLLLHRDRLGFRQYIKGKNAKYVTKLFKLCTYDSYVLNTEMYKEKSLPISQTSKIDSRVLRFGYASIFK